ncbi:MAG: 50S ribosomal protein L25/general stress protein Ctc [Bacteroidales bacterium]|jgi:large subunit ribosomal protein L25|nr:50S ribosomal protein L25/general stress protein Ctc [Bacteroidales bacterium]HBL73419.1 50S ribosomal protein L25 [Bacteroidales bacterium]
MKTLQLSGSIRADFGKKSAKSFRKEGQVPCVIYGGEKVIHFNLDENDLRNLIVTPNIYAVELNIDGDVHMAILKDAQFHPVKDNTLHVDFMEIFENKPIIMEVPVKLNGLSEGVKAGGKLSQELRKLKVKGFYKNIPDVLNIDVTNLGLGKTMQVGTLSFDNLDIVTPKQAIVCAVKLTRVARGLAAAAAKADAKK